MNELAAELDQVVAAAGARLGALSAAQAAEPWAPGKTWTRQQVLGHLLDSASNNHQRFVRLRYTDRLELPGYEQDDWVNAQHPEEREWADVVAFWVSYNRHLAHVIRHLDPATLEHRWAAPGGDLTLRFIAEDYVRHVRHHLDQIFGTSDGRSYAERKAALAS